MNTDVYYNKNGHVYLVENTYDKSLTKIDRVLEYAKTIGLTIPEREDIKVEVLAGERYKRMLSVEFKSKTKPTKGEFMDDNSPFWRWLQY